MRTRIGIAIVVVFCATFTMPAQARPRNDATAADPFALCREQFAYAPEDYDSAYCFYQTAVQQRLVAEGARIFESLIREHRLNHWLPLAYGHLYRESNPERAEALYRVAADAFRHDGHVAGEIVSRSTLRAFLFLKGRLEDAEAQVKRVLSLDEVVDDPLLKAQIWHLEALHLQETGGDLGRAYRLLKKVYKVAFPAGPYRLRRDCLYALGLVAFRLGRTDEALAKYVELEQLASAERDLRGKAAARYNILNVASLKEALLPTPGARLRLILLAKRALESGLAAQQAIVTLKTHGTMAVLLAADRASRAEALEHVKECQALSVTTRQPHDEAVCSWIEASLLRESDPRRSRAAQRRALAAAVRTQTPVTQAYSAGRHMRSSWDTKPRVEAISDSLAAIDAIEALRGTQDEDDVGAELFSFWTLDYYWLSGRLLGDLHHGELDLAFAITERVRARSLLDRLEERERETQPAREVVHSAKRATPTFATLDDVQRALAENEAMLLFQVGIWNTYAGEFGGGSWIIAVTRHGRSVHRIPDRGQLAPMIPVFTGILARDNDVRTAAAARLHRDILADALNALPRQIERLILVPDGPLHRLPFDGLQATPGAAPLAARYELTVVPSATLWLRWRQQRPPAAPRAALVFADPDAPRLDRLPHARRERRALEHHVAGVESLVAGQASERALKQRDLRKYTILHFAAHAIADDTHPERSAVMLAPGAADEDGLLEAREIEGLNLDGRVVVLSACETASGAVLSGEGVLSLARAFFAAGAHAVIGTRWAIRDEDAASLFDTFYRVLGRGATLSEALSKAKLEAIDSGRPAAAWASLVVIGDGEFRPFPGGRHRPSLTLSIAPVFAIALLIAVTGYVAARLRSGPPYA